MCYNTKIQKLSPNNHTLRIDGLERFSVSGFQGISHVACTQQLGAAAGYEYDLSALLLQTWSLGIETDPCPSLRLVMAAIPY